MKGIKESILSSTVSGKERVRERIQQWIDATEFGSFIKSGMGTVTRFTAAIDKDGGIIFHSDNALIGQRAEVSCQDIEDKLFDKSWKFKKFVDSKGKVLDVVYRNGVITDNLMVDEVSNGVDFVGCDLKIKHLPKGCQHIDFNVQHTLGGAYGCHIIDDWKGMKVGKVLVGTTNKGVCGLSSLNHFKNCTFTDLFYLTDAMLGYYSYDSKHRCLSEQAGKELKEFLKNNHIDCKQLLYKYPSDSKHYLEVGKVIYDEKKDVFKIKTDI